MVSAWLRWAPLVVTRCSLLDFASWVSATAGSLGKGWVWKEKFFQLKLEITKERR
jgi:hypothetical protein